MTAEDKDQIVAQLREKAKECTSARWKLTEFDLDLSEAKTILSVKIELFSELADIFESLRAE